MRVVGVFEGLSVNKKYWLEASCDTEKQVLIIASSRMYRSCSEKKYQNKSTKGLESLLR